MFKPKARTSENGKVNSPFTRSLHLWISAFLNLVINDKLSHKKGSKFETVQKSHFVKELFTFLRPSGTKFWLNFMDCVLLQR